MTMRLNYANWKTDNKSILETLSDKKVLMAFSGGKDCSIVLHYLYLAGKDFGFEFEAVGATYPNHVYPPEETKRLSDYWHSRNIDINWISPGQSDSVMEEAEQEGKSACRVCQNKKRTMLGSYLKRFEQSNKEIVIVISFTLWDIVTYSVEYMLGGIFKPDDKTTTSGDMITDDRIKQTSHRFYQFFKIQDGLSIFKPLIKYNDEEIRKAVSEANVPFSDIDCKYKNTRTKRVLFDYYKQMNLSFDYDKVLNFYEKTLKLHDLSFYTGLDKENLIKIL